MRRCASSPHPRHRAPLPRHLCILNTCWQPLSPALCILSLSLCFLWFCYTGPVPAQTAPWVACSAVAAYMLDTMSESPGSVTVSTDTRCSLPQAVPRSTLLPV